ncbi:GDSL-type esterase/lipase family protein [Actinospica robiniae]|uniref:GDSL-type esterase/lipase family protein n=1 Tax=Actinospica robiniae TaxID=304901 RepID=UPI000413CB00|nr:GDSL-type esterase/lipase family protein [Actinospica robiniae]
MFTTRRRLGRIGVLVVVALTGLGTLAPGALAAASPQDARPTAAVSMGDSYISGEAGRWQGNAVPPSTSGDVWGTDRAAYDCDATSCQHDPSRVYGASYGNGCDRSDVSEIQSATLPVDQRVNLACSGAVTDNVLPAADGGQTFKGEAPQVDQLATLAARDDVKLIVVSVSGNDLNFGGVLTTCFRDFTLGLGPCEASQQPALTQAITAVEPKVEAVLASIRATMAAAGYKNSDYRLVLQSYPSPFPDGGDFRYPETYARLTTGGCPIYDTDATWAHDVVVAQIAAMLEQAAAAQGAEFLDVQRADAGHEVCATSAAQATSADSPANPIPAAQAEWIRFVTTGATQGILQESIHPNAYGQAALGSCLTKFWAQAPGQYACTATANQGLEGISLTPES